MVVPRFLMQDAAKHHRPAGLAPEPFPLAPGPFPPSVSPVSQLVPTHRCMRPATASPSGVTPCPWASLVMEEMVETPGMANIITVITSLGTAGVSRDWGNHL